MAARDVEVHASQKLDKSQLCTGLGGSFALGWVAEISGIGTRFAATGLHRQSPRWRPTTFSHPFGIPSPCVSTLTLIIGDGEVYDKQQTGIRGRLNLCPRARLNILTRQAFDFDDIESVNHRPLNIWLHAKCRRDIDEDEDEEMPVQDADVQLNGPHEGNPRGE